MLKEDILQIQAEWGNHIQIGKNELDAKDIYYCLAKEKHLE